MGEERFWILRTFCGLLLGLSGAVYTVAPAHAAREKIDVALLLDNSGSMVRQHNAHGSDERFMRVTAVQYLLEKMAPGDRAALITFDTQVHADPACSRLCDVTAAQVKAAFYQGARRIAASPHGDTDMAAGLRAAEAILTGNGDRSRKRFLIFLTDGLPDPPRGANTPPQIVQLATKIGREGIVIHTIGLGELSPQPAEAAAAQKLLEDIAREGRGTPYRVTHPEELPALFGSIFAQLAGHEVSHIVPAGIDTPFTLAPGTRNLRILAIRDGTTPQITLTDPQGKVWDKPRAVAPLVGGNQTGWLSVFSLDAPTGGAWKVRAAQGALEVAWEPSFEAALIAPRDHARIPDHAPLTFLVDVHEKGTGAAKPVQGRVEVEYRPETGATGVPAALPLTAVADTPGRYQGVLPDSGAPGQAHITVRCFRTGASGEEEGGPDYAEVQVARIPVLEVAQPASGAAFTLPGPIPVRATLRLDGQPLSTPERGLKVRAALQGPGGTTTADLAPGADGAFAGGEPTGSATGAVLLRVTLEGRYAGADLDPQTVTLPLTLVAHPTVSLRWERAAVHTGMPDTDWSLSAHVCSSAGTPQQIHLVPDGIADAVVEPAMLAVAANQPDHVVPIHIRWRHAAPGNYRLAITAERAGGDADLNADPFTAQVHIPTWLERNRWWFYPLVALLVLLALACAVFVSLWTREQARRQRKMLAVLNGAALYVPGTAQPFRPAEQKVLARRSYTFGGQSADVFIPDPAQPGQALFKEPRLRIAVDWDRRHRQPRLVVTPEGTDTMLYDRTNNLIGEPIVPTEGGAFFFVDPEHILVRVNSEWTA